jgi:heavy metal sensor kinase
VQRLQRTRVRLTLVYAGIVLPIAVLAAAAFWAVFATLELSSIDASLGAQAQVLSPALTGGSPGPLPAVTQTGIAVNAVLFSSTGRVIARSDQVRTPRAYWPGDVPSGPPLRVTRRVDGLFQRLLAERVDFGDSGSGVLVLARPLDELEETLALVAVLLAVAVAVLVLGAAGLGYWLAGRALSPVWVMAGTARDITEHDLHRRIDLQLPPGDELGELAATFNSMLDRLETAFDSLQRFTADAAHELRAPLALMRAQVDVTLRRDRTPEEYRASHEAMLVEIERLTHLADQLLLLARADAGALQLHPADIDLPELVEDVVERWRPAALERQVRLEGEAPLEGVVRADPELVRRLLDNLLDNAVRHTPPDGMVRVCAEADEGGGWRLAVEDTGPGIAPALRPGLFERFTRGDAARGRHTGGAGLGLSLCAAIAAAHGGEIQADDRPEGTGARLVVLLP